VVRLVIPAQVARGRPRGDLMRAFAPSGFSSYNRITKMLVGAVGIEVKAPLRIRKLLIPLNSTNVKSALLAQVWYTPGTRPSRDSGSKNRFPRTPFLAKLRFADKLEVELPLFYLTDQ
jgi:hypothetical protein